MQLCQGTQSPSSPAKGRQGPSTGRQELGLLLSPPGSVLSLEAKAAPPLPPHPRLFSTPETSAEMLEPNHLPCLCGPVCWGPAGELSYTGPAHQPAHQQLPQALAAPAEALGPVAWDCPSWAPRGRQRLLATTPQPPLGQYANLCPLQVPEEVGAGRGQELQQCPLHRPMSVGSPVQTGVGEGRAGGGLSKSCL